ncbi:glucokinase [Ectothiorhodospiraceae bacterium BW-2]|nr:glucokinase [Ectothiorhodospiraceae bacterium BW-2]
MTPIALAADIGGTHTRLALFSPHDRNDRSAAMTIVRQSELLNSDYPSLEAAITAFLPILEQREAIHHSALALAAPINSETVRVTLTNLSWVVERERLQQLLPHSENHLINDFEAQALGTLSLTASEHKALLPNQPAPAAEGVRVVIGPGTGLGQAYVYHDHQQQHIFATEGGHTDFAPLDNEQLALWQFLQPHYGHLSYERLLSGEGLQNIYRFYTGTPMGVTVATPAEISALAARPLIEAQRAVQLFCKIYGAFAGNVALSFRPAGGIWLTGGMSDKLADWIDQPAFSQSYLAKGRMEAVVAAIPLRRVLSQQIGLRGAMHWLVQHLSYRTSLL